MKEAVRKEVAFRTPRTPERPSRASLTPAAALSEAWQLEHQGAEANFLAFTRSAQIWLEIPTEHFSTQVNAEVAARALKEALTHGSESLRLVTLEIVSGISMRRSPLLCSPPQVS